MTQEKQEDLFGTTFKFTCGRHDTVYTYSKGKYTWCGSEPVNQDYAIQCVKEGHWKLLPSETASQNAPKPSLEETFTLAENAAKEALKPIEREVCEPPTIQGIVQEWVGDNDGKRIYSQGHTVYFINKHCDNVEVKYKYKNPNPSFAEAMAECKTHVQKVNLPAKYFSPDASEEDKAVLESTRKLLDNVHTPMPSPLLYTIKNACTQSEGRIVVQVTEDGFDIYHRVFFEDSVHVKEDKLEEFLKALLLVDGADTWE